MPSGAELAGNRIVITGPTSQVAKPIAKALAQRNEVIGLARFADPEARRELEAAGVRCVSVDLAAPDLSGVPVSADLVLNFAVSKTRDFDHDLAANVQSIGHLMSHLSDASALVHCSSTAVYQPAGRHPFVETDPLGDNHRVLAFMPTYSICKIAAEAMARFVAREHRLPTIIARLNVPYGDNGGWPALHLEQILAGQPIAVHTDQPCLYNPIHEDDIVAAIPKLVSQASVPATVVNWGGDEAVSIEDWTAWLAELVGKPRELFPTDQTLESVTIDQTRQHELLGRCSVHWKDGMRRMVATAHPELDLRA